MQLSLLLAALALTAALSAPVPVQPEDTAPGVSAEQTETQTRFVLHAGGTTPSGIAGTNSVEALDHSYALGYRCMEIDFCWTSDGQLACVHDWESWYPIGHVPTAAEFDALRADRGFTSLTVADLADWLRSHSDAAVVTDVKERNVEAARLLADACPDLLDRFIVQIYAPEQYAAVRACGFSHVWLTLYQLPWEVKTDTALLGQYVRACGLEALVFSVELVPRAGYVDELLALGVPLYAHTANTAEEQDALRAAGIFGIYTDCGDAYAP